MRELHIVIEDLNPYGGMERCTLEVARRLSHRWPVHLHACSLEKGTGSWGRMTFHRVRGPRRLPGALRHIWFYALTTPRLLSRRLLRRGARPVIHASGACSLVSDVIQVHFVQAAWRQTRRRLPPGETMTPRMAAASAPLQAVLRAYYGATLWFDMVTERLTFRRNKVYVAVSHGVARELERHFGPGLRTHVVHHGVDAGEFHPVDPSTRAEREALRAEIGVGSGEAVALLVGAWDRKGLDKAIEALALLTPDERSGTRLLAVGAGARPVFEALAGRLGVGDRVILAPHQKGIARWYRAADFLLFPTKYEPFGMVVLEAMACGLPVVVSRCAGAADLVEDGASGLLIEDPLDAREIVSAWRRLLLHPAEREAMGRKARETASRHTWDRVAEEYAAMLDPFMA